MALLVSNRLASMKVEVVYRDPSGHTLIVTMNVLGRLPLLACTLQRHVVREAVVEHQRVTARVELLHHGEAMASLWKF